MPGGRGEKTVCKVRAINLNYNASKLVNFERIKEMILSSGDVLQTVVNVHTWNKLHGRGKGRISLNNHRTEGKFFRIFQAAAVR